jgi:copper transport protein
VAAVVALLLGAAPAQAHSELERSDPPNGGMVAPGRDFVTLWFGEPVSGSTSTFVLHLADGTAVQSRVSSIDGGRRVVRIDTSPLDRGIYQLEWRTIALDDGHPSSGTLTFGVGLRPAVLPSEGSALPGGTLLAVRWLDLSAILLAIGALTVSGGVLTALGEAGRRARRRTRSLAVAAMVAAVYTGAVTPFLRTQHPGNPPGVWLGETWSTLTGTPWGHVWLAREAAVVVAAVAVWSWARSRGRSAARHRVAVAALVAVSLLEAMAGHASDLARGTVPAVVASAAHLVAAGVWAGGLVVLTACLVPMMRRDADVRGPILSTAWRGFSPLAAVASVVLLASGLYQAGAHLPDPGAVRTTVYGGAVAAKTVLVVVALAMAGLNTLLVHPHLAGTIGTRLGRRPGWAPVSLRRFTSVVVVEAAVLVTAVVAAALVTSVPTAREVADASEATAPHHTELNGLFVTFEEVPAGPDRVSLQVRVRPTTLPVPAPVREVRVVLAGPEGSGVALAMVPVEKGRYEATTARLAPGTWLASVSVLRDGLPDTVVRASWTVDDPGSDAASPLRVATTALAVLLLLVLATGCWLYRRRRLEAIVDPALPVLERHGGRR